MFKSIKKRLSNKEKKGDASPSGGDPKQPASQGGAGQGAGQAPAAAAASGKETDKKAGGGGGGGGSGAKGDKKRSSKKERASGRAGGPRSLAVTDLLPELAEPTRADLLKPQQSFQSVPAEERPMLFVRKLRLCSVVFHFEVVDETQPPQSPQPQDREEQRAKEVKRQLLLELVDHLQKYRSFITEPILIEMLRMVSINLFRPLPMKPRDAFLDPDEEEPMYDPQWPHLQIVYEFFLRFIVASDVEVRMLKKHINGAFVLNVLELFDSEDPRERDYLKTILHRIYAKFMSLRAFIRKAINNAFYTFIYDTQRHAGTAELLEILGSIINGFALPLKDEHKLFLRRVLIPMHKVRPLPHFHQQLSYCVTQFVNKDAELAVPVLHGLIKLWPVTNSSKEVLFIGELEEVLELTQTEQFREVMVPLFKQVARSIGSPHFQVAERALFLWHNEYISSLIADHKDVILPLIFPVLSRNSQTHWNPTVMNLTVNVLKIFMEMDSVLVQECSKRLEEEQRRRDVERARRTLTWQRLEEAHASSGQEVA